MKLSASFPLPEFIRNKRNEDLIDSRGPSGRRKPFQLYLQSTARLLGLILLLTCTGVVGAQDPPTPTLTSDKEDYQPGETATLTGSGFQAGETVTLQVLHQDYQPGDPIGEDHEPWEVTADENGGFVTTWHVCEDDCVGEFLVATANGQTSGSHAEAYFTDAIITITANTLWSNIVPTPTSLDAVVVTNGATVTVDIATAVCQQIRLGRAATPNPGDGTLTFQSGSQLTVTDAVAFGDGSRIGTINLVSGATMIVGNGDDGFRNANTSNQSALNMSGGLLQISGRLELENFSTSSITGGSITVDPQATLIMGAANHIVRFAAGANLTFTGGTLTIVDPHAAAGVGNVLQVEAGSGTKNFAGSTIRFGDGTSTSSGSAEGFDLNAGSGVVLGNIVINNPGGTNRHVTLAANNANIGGDLTITAGELRATDPTPAPTVWNIFLAGNWSNSGTFTPGTGKVTFNGAAQSIGGSTATTFYNLDIGGTANKVLGNDITINNALILLNRNIDAYTNSKTVYAKGTVTRTTTGHIMGFLKKDVPTGAVTIDFEVGQALYAPIEVKFNLVTVAGTLKVQTVDGDHPSIGTSSLDPANSINRYWTVIKGGGLDFTTCGITLNYNDPDDHDAGTTPATFKVGKFDNPVWTYPTVINGPPTAIEIRAIGLGDFSDLIVASCAAATISDQPDNVVGCVGGSAVFNVTAGPVGSKSFQWYKENGATDIELDDEDDGGDIQISNGGATLTINDLIAGDAGSYYVIVTRDCGSSVTSNVATLTIDQTAPTIPTTFVSKTSLWPPNHKMVDIALSASDGAGSGITSATVTVTSNEPVNDLGDGNTDPDIAWTGGVQTNTSPYTVSGPVTVGTDGKFHINLRAERSGVQALVTPDIGRIYTVTLTVTDGCGNTTGPVSNTVTVAHNITSPNTASSFKIGTTVSLAGTFWDIPGNRHTAKWQIDGTSVNGTVSAEPSGNKVGKVTGSYKPTVAGVYKLKMNITDQKGVTSYATTNGDQEAFLVAYDPNGGYTYGAGKFISPLGALTANPNATGKVAFGFTSNYFRNATYPKGETELAFKVADFEFYALNFDYLVISGAKAQYKGLGKTIVNGTEQSGLAFILTVIDGQLSGGGGVDKIRLKIYNKNTGAVVYDNQRGASDNADPVTAVTEPKTNGTDIVVMTTTTATTQTQRVAPETLQLATELAVRIQPNPTPGHFALHVTSGSDQDRIILQVFDQLGRLVENRTIAPGLTDRIGNNYTPGVYYFRVIQGQTQRDIKVLKLPD